MRLITAPQALEAWFPSGRHRLATGSLRLGGVDMSMQRDSQRGGTF